MMQNTTTKEAVMSKKDYIKIAEAVKQSHEIAAYSRLSLLTDKLCEIFKADNPKFDGARFRAACQAHVLHQEG